MERRDYAVARMIGIDRYHTVNAAGGPRDGSLYGFRTFCGLKIDDPSRWRELDKYAPRDHARDCKRCARVQ